MEKKYWESISKNYEVEIFDVLKNDKRGIIETYIRNIAASSNSIADVGCAVGKWLPILSDQFSKVYAIDFSTECLKYAKAKYGKLSNIEFLNIDFTKPYKANLKFEAVLCVNAVIIDSYSKREIFFKSLFSSLQNEGHLILVVPSFESVLYREFIFDKCRRRDIVISKSNETMDKKAYKHFKLGTVNIDKIPTKHFLREELIMTLHSAGFKVDKIDKIEYSWETEIHDAPKWLKTPYPWDWIVIAQKKK